MSALTVLLVFAPDASAATGDLTYRGCFQQQGAGCEAQAPDGIDAVSLPARPIVSPDGASAYVGNGGGIVTFRRGDGGRLTFRGCVGAFGCTKLPPRAPWPFGGGTALTPDGRDLYTLVEDGIAHLRVDATGLPAYLDCIGRANMGCRPLSSPDRTYPLDQAKRLAISPDSRHVYVGTGQQRLLTFERDESGDLIYAGCIGAGESCVSLPATCAPSGRCTDALNEPDSVQVSPNGRELFVASNYGNLRGLAAVSHFRRASDGSLAFVECLGPGVGCLSTGSGPLDGAQTLAIGPNSRDVYVGAESIDASDAAIDVVAHLRLGEDGRLRFSDCLARGAVSGCNSLPAGVDALRLPRSVVASPDGASVYVQAIGSHAITHLRVGGDGRLSFAGCMSDQFGCVPPGTRAWSHQGISVSPDGSNLYAAADDSIMIFQRELGFPPPQPPSPPPPPPPSALTEEATSIGQSAATLQATVNPLGRPTTYKFEYGPTTSYGSVAPAASAPAGEGNVNRAVSYRVTGLQPGRAYHFRVAASNAAGTRYGKDSSFETEAPSAEVPVGLPAVRELGRWDRSVTYQVSASHAGFLDDEFVPPLRERWSRSFSGEVSYPVIAEGKVFVVVAAPAPPQYRLYAIDARSGGTLWRRDFETIPPPAGGVAYEEGKVFVASSELFAHTSIDTLAAFDAATGHELWRTDLPQYWLTAPPVAADGAVYLGMAGVGGDAAAIDATDGRLIWDQPVGGGADSSPALSADKLFVSYPCKAYGLSRSAGTVIWRQQTNCSGGGGRTPVYAGGRVFVRDLARGGLVLDADSGSLLRGFTADPDDPLPAVAGEKAFFLRAGKLIAEGAASGSEVWRFDGDGTLATPPLVVGENVFVGSSAGRVYMLSAQSGEVVSTFTVGTPILAAERWNAFAWVGLGAGNGLLVIPAGQRLVAYSPAERPSADRLPPDPTPVPGPAEPPRPAGSTGGTDTPTRGEAPVDVLVPDRRPSTVGTTKQRGCVVPRLKGVVLRKAEVKLRRAGCKYRMRGRGRVRSSFPRAGAKTTKTVIIRATPRRKRV